MVFAHPFWLFLVVLLPLPWIWLRRKGFVGFSDVNLLRQVPGNTFLYKLPLMFLSLAFVALLIALARPQLVHKQSMQTIRARDIIVAVDISGSMGSPFEGDIPKREGPSTELDKMPAPPPKPAKPGEDPD